MDMDTRLASQGSHPALARWRRFLRALVLPLALAGVCMPVGAGPAEARPAAGAATVASAAPGDARPTADRPPPPASPAPLAQALTPGAVQLPLSRLLGSTAPLRMENTDGALSLPLPLPALWQPREMVLTLSGRLSQALIGGSQWVVEVNGHPVHQLAISGARTEIREQIRIPPQRLKAGFNDVKLRYVQHYTDRCEYPMAPQLWGVLDPAESGWTVQADWQPVPARLDRLNDLFDKTGWEERPLVPVWMSRPTSATQLQAAGLVAQGVGLRYAYVPVRMQAAALPQDMASAATLDSAARGVVVIATRADLAARGLLRDLDLPADAGPLVAVQPLPGDARRFMLVFTADRDEDLPAVASTFAMPRMSWPAQPWVAVRRLEMPPLGSVTGAASQLRPSTNAFPLSAMGYRTTTFEGMGTQGSSLRVWNPGWQTRVQLRLHLSYAAGMGEASALNVRANGVLQGSVPLGDAAGGRYEAYAVTLPAGALEPGWNTLQIQPVLLPRSNGGDCKPFLLGNLGVTVYEDSTLQFIGGVDLARPDLGLLSRDGRPLLRAPVGLGMAIQLTDGQPATLGAGLTLMSKIAQVFNGPLLRTEFRIGASSSAVNRIWLGPLDGFSAALRGVLRLDEAGLRQLPVPLIKSATVPVLEGGDTLTALRSHVETLGAAPAVLSAQVSLAQPLRGMTLLGTGLVDGQPNTVFAALDAATLERGVHELTGHTLWSQLRGQHVLWRGEGDQLQALDDQDAPFVAYSLRGGMGLWISQYPWASLMTLVLALLVLAWLGRRLLLAYRNWRHPVRDVPL